VRLAAAGALLAAALAGAGACGDDDGAGNGKDASAGGTAGAPDASDDACPPATKSCSGACVALDDPAHGCAASDCAPCDQTHGTASCASGACTIGCEPGWGDCDGDAKTGCETDLGKPESCGGCTIVCLPGESCASGKCQAVCGDGAIGSNEQCDDGNLNNLDGCDASCQYEAVARMTMLSIVSGTAPPHCTPATNQFGSAFQPGMIALLNNELTQSVASGSFNLFVQLLDLDALDGSDDAALGFGTLIGDLDTRHPDAWTAGSIDYWFLASADSIDAQGKPLAVVTGASLVSKLLSADAPILKLPFGGSALELRDAHLRAKFGDATDVPAPPPSKLATGLAVFQTLSAVGGGLGLCGNATVESLSKVPLPKTFAAGGLAACEEIATLTTCLTPPTTSSHVYTWCGEHCGNPGDSDYDATGCGSCAPERCNSNPVAAGCNSLLDAIVGGCIVNPPDCVTAFLPTQPDTGSGGQPPATLQGNPANGHKVTVSAPNDGYSAFFEFSANRAHLTNNLP
jgi:cysteine-rich repeat protein